MSCREQGNRGCGRGFNQRGGRAEALHRVLDGYDHTLRTFLYHGFTQGFRMPHSGDCPSNVPNNLKSALEQLQVVDAKLQVEFQAKRLAGPFDKKPLQNFVCLSIRIVSKKDKGKFRLIHHLSYPSGLSVNEGISKQYTSMSYQTVDDAVVMIQNLGRCFLAKTDIAYMPLKSVQYTQTIILF